MNLVGPTSWPAWMRRSASLSHLVNPAANITPLPVSLNAAQASRLPALGAPASCRRTACLRLENFAGRMPALPVGQRGFSLLEIMVAVALLAIIIVGLLAMFYQVQRAFRSGTAQVDVMENGRAATSLIVREAQEAIALQLEPITNMAVVIPVNARDNAPVFPSGVRQALPGGETRQNYLRDFYFLSRMNDEWIGTAYRISNAVSGVGTLYRLVERQTTNNPWFFASNFAIATPYNNTNFRRVMDGVVHFTVDFYDTNGWLIAQANNAYRPDQGYAMTNGMLPAYVDLELAVLEPIPLEKFRYRYNANPVQAGTYLANQAARTHVFRQRVPIRPGPADYGQ